VASNQGALQGRDHAGAAAGTDAVERELGDGLHVGLLVGGRRYRILNVLERLSREHLASEVDTSLPAVRVIRVLDEIALERGYPARILIDNGSEFRSTALDAWA